MMTRVVIVGLDGATLDLMDPWMNQGKLPSFERIRDHGAYGKLRSTTPYYSAPAWVSIVTGCNRGNTVFMTFSGQIHTKKIL